MIRNFSDNFTTSIPQDDPVLKSFAANLDIRLIGFGEFETGQSTLDGFMSPSFLAVVYRRGKVKISHGSQQTILEAGSFFIFRPYEIYSGGCIDPAVPCFSYVLFDLMPFTEKYNFGQVIANAPDSVFAGRAYRQMGQLLQELVEESGRKPGSATLFRQQVKNVAVRLAFDQLGQTDPRSFIKSSTDAKLINQTLLYASTHLSEPVRISKIVQETFSSKTSLDRAFRNSLGCSPQQAITNFKIERAAELLQHGYMVKDIARELGYSSVYHFSNTFKTVTGMRPTEYKSRLLQRH